MTLAFRCFVFALASSHGAGAYQPPLPYKRLVSTNIRTTHRGWVTPASTQDEITAENATEDSDETKLCFYRSPQGRWTQRLNLVDLDIGQPLFGTIVDELLEAKTGPKLFFECGVGRVDGKGDWQMVHGMLRFYGRGTKKSVVRKKAARLRKREQVELFVSRLFVDSGRLEVCTSMEDVEGIQKMTKALIPASSLQLNQELAGTVDNILPYGVMVDVGANRNGLLHISKVADLYGRYIDKEKGLEEAGLERGAKIRLAVIRNEKKKLELDFTPDVKVEAEKERKAKQEEKLKRRKAREAARAAAKSAVEEPEVSSHDPYDISEEEGAAWAEYAGMEQQDEEEDDEEGYDEDRDIEDALGLGMY